MGYDYKPNPWSSHTLLMRCFPEAGEGRRVLDVGCGPGYLSSLLAARGYVVTGIERQEGTGPNPFPSSVTLIEADLEAGLPRLTETFDYVLCADILEHLRDPGRLLRQLRAVLSPGATLIASLPNSGNIWFRLNVLFGRFPQEEKGLFDRTHVRFYVWKGWRKLLEGAGFRIHSVETSSIPVGLMLPEPLRESAPVLAFESVCYGLARMRMQLFAYQFIVQASADRQG
ncbi:MAG TPA: class I SAM-dependent methyltransferase [Bryobacteraceae bacterium]|nr:class I SAM-dependent methyltransferase [Bryobacteraceae bacterium]